MDELKYSTLENLLQSLLQLRKDLNNTIEAYPLLDRTRIKHSLQYSSIRSLIEKILHDIDTKNPHDIDYASYKPEFIILFRMFDESGYHSEIEESFNSLRREYQNFKKLILNDN